MKSDIFKLLAELKEEIPQQSNKNNRVLLVDAFNLFFRNFSVLNNINHNGSHIGGLGGFLRSLGVIIREIKPTSCYIIFDGEGSTINRKNILPEYKSDRHIRRITNWDIFDNLEEEEEAKYNQIARLIQYLKCLPVKVMSIEKSEADDIIAYASKYLVNKYNSKIFIVSNDKDYFQLVNKNITVYKPDDKKYYGEQDIIDKYNLLPSNFIIYKTLLGDGSDNIGGVKGLGEKKILKKFPELINESISIQDVFDISEKKLKDHIIYARILQNEQLIRSSYRIMDLHNPFIDENGIKYIEEVIEQETPLLQASILAYLYNEDQLGGIIHNLNFWIKENFTTLNNL